MFSDDFYYYFIHSFSSHFHFITQYVQYDTYVHNYCQCRLASFLCVCVCVFVCVCVIIKCDWAWMWLNEHTMIIYVFYCSVVPYYACGKEPHVQEWQHGCIYNCKYYISYYIFYVLYLSSKQIIGIFRGWETSYQVYLPVICINRERFIQLKIYAYDIDSVMILEGASVVQWQTKLNEFQTKVFTCSYHVIR